MATFTGVTITITPPGLAPLVVNCTSAEAAQAGELSAVQGLTIAWGQSTPIDSQDAGRVELQLLSADPLPAPWESEVTIDGQIDGRPAVRLGRGWVASAKYRPRGELWLSRITLADVVGRAMATKPVAADATWPAEEVGDRLARIAAGAGWDLAEALAFSSTVAQTKVTSSATAYELADHALRSWPAAAVEGLEGLTGRVLDANRVTWPGYFTSDATPFPGAVDVGEEPLLVPASAIGSEWRGPDRASALTQVRYTTRDAAGATVDTVVPNPLGAVAGSTAELAVTADATLSTYHLANYRELLADVDGRALVTLEPGQLVTTQVDAATLEALVAVPGRAARAIRITGCPDDLDPFQTITAGTLTLDAGLSARLAITLQPTRLAGVRPLRWSDWPRVGDLPPADVADDRTYVPATFDRLDHTLTARQTQAVAHPRRDRYMS